ncbi:hypothetical protein [Pontiella agarivorans]|uniref:Uncharacterized protein n=1 Tax=Pontiella agarivorans TaxID=3038953 RepID=A0ABU5MUZ9_9BACT|nr:hypothetical protein [Pontiella agarivorans]MDZ8118054.1 hypothetical protein [Pontiella agarivorans]
MKRFRKKAVDASLLGENFGSIRNVLTEILGFKEKRYKPTPAHEVRKKVDIESAWPSCRDQFNSMFEELTSIAKQLDMKTTTINPNLTFVEAIETFIVQLNSIVYSLADAVGTGRHTLDELIEVNDRILKIQLSANDLERFVLSEFKYPGMPGAED